MRHFHQDEFSEPLIDVNPRLLAMLDDFRDDVGRAIIPSRAPGALCRYDAEEMGSPHYAVGRQSTAADVFIPNSNPGWIFLRALLFGFSGVGVYFDTHDHHGNPETMYHLDIRSLVDGKVGTCWYREHKKYHYVRYHEGLSSEFLARIARGYDGQ